MTDQLPGDPNLPPGVSQDDIDKGGVCPECSDFHEMCDDCEMELDCDGECVDCDYPEDDDDEEDDDDGVYTSDDQG